jgi:transposase
MGMSRRVFTSEFKRAAVNELKSGKPLGFVARRLEVSSNTLARWRRELEKQPTKAFSGHGKRMLAESREGELERKIGQLTMENDFLKNCCGVSRSNRKPRMAADRLPEGPRRRQNDNPAVPGRRRESSRILSVYQPETGERGRDAVARRDSENSSRDAGVWPSADYC